MIKICDSFTYVLRLKKDIYDIINFTYVFFIYTPFINLIRINKQDTIKVMTTNKLKMFLLILPNSMIRVSATSTMGDAGRSAWLISLLR